MHGLGLGLGFGEKKCHSGLPGVQIHNETLKHNNCSKCQVLEEVEINYCSVQPGMWGAVASAAVASR